MQNPYNDDDYYIVHPEKKHITRRISHRNAGVRFGTPADQSPSIKHALDYANKTHGAGHVVKTGRELFHSQKGSSEHLYKNITEETMKEYVNQAPFSFGMDMYEGFAPKQHVLTEDNDDAPRSTGNAFDWKARAAKKKEEEGENLRNHQKVKTETGAVYKRKEDAKGADETDTAPAEKRGRGRPAGKYGSYKKRIAEALSSFGTEQIDELSKDTLKSYSKKAEKSEKSATKTAEKADARHAELSGKIGMARDRRVAAAQKGKGSGRIQSSAETKLRGKQDSALTDKFSALITAARRRKGLASADSRLTKESYEDLDEGVTPKGHTIEAYGVKGMKSAQWRKTFKHHDHLHDWAEKNDAEVHGTRDLEAAKKGSLQA